MEKKISNSELFKLANKIRGEKHCSSSEAYKLAKEELMKPTEDLNKFNLTRALNGSPVKTKSGKNAKVICKTNDGKILVFVSSNIGSYMDRTIKYCIDGSRWSSNYSDNEDLVMV